MSTICRFSQKITLNWLVANDVERMINLVSRGGDLGSIKIAAAISEDRPLVLVETVRITNPIKDKPIIPKSFLNGQAARFGKFKKITF